MILASSCLPESHPLDNSVSLFVFFSPPSPQELSLLAPLQPLSRAHTRALTGCNAGAPGAVRIRGCGTILSSVDCKYGLPAGESGNRQQTNEADLQRQRTAIISEG